MNNIKKINNLLIHMVSLVEDKLKHNKNLDEAIDISEIIILVTFSIAIIFVSIRFF